MLTKTKIALAVCGSLIAGGIGLAAAQGYGGGNGGRAGLIQKYDTNGDGQLDAQEIAAMRADIQAKREARRAKLLAKWDTNHDGKLEPEERMAMRQARAEEMFKRLDTNGDGELSLQEFEQARMFHRHHRRGGNGNGGGFGFGGGQGQGGTPDAQP
jgi:hypothetical protein